MNNLIFILILLLSPTLKAQKQETIKSQLNEIYDQNLQLRKQVMPIIKKYGFKSSQMDSLNILIMKFDSTALNKVILIVNKFGWLGF